MRIHSGFKSRAATCTAIVLVATLLGLGPGPSARAGQAPCRPAAPGERLAVDFRGVGLGIIGRYVSCKAGISLLYTPADLRERKVTVVAPSPVPVEALVRVFEAGLRDHGLLVEKRGAYYVIRPSDQAPSKRRSTSGR